MAQVPPTAADSTDMINEPREECPDCSVAATCCCGWHDDGGTVPLPELAEAAPL